MEQRDLPAASARGRMSLCNLQAAEMTPCKPAEWWEDKKHWRQHGHTLSLSSGLVGGLLWSIVADRLLWVYVLTDRQPPDVARFEDVRSWGDHAGILGDLAIVENCNA